MNCMDRIHRGVAVARAGRRRGFTITEILLVIVIASIVLLVAVPAFRGMLRSSEQSLAQNSVRVALTIARDLATVGEGDTAAVFLFDPETGYSIVVGRVVASLENAPFPDYSGGISPTRGVYDIIVPIAEAAPLNLPDGWAARGYAPPGLLGPDVYGRYDWYDNALYTDDGMAADVDAVAFSGQWLFPETGFFDASEQARPVANADHTARQSFMVRFKSGTGEWTRGRGLSLFMDPRPSGEDRNQLANDMAGTEVDNSALARLDRVEDLTNWAERVASTADLNGNGFSNDNSSNEQSDVRIRDRLLGPRSHDSVVVKSVNRVAVYRQVDLARGIGSRGLNGDTGSLYVPFESGPTAPAGQEIGWDLGGVLRSVPGGSTVPNVRQRINRWVWGDTNFDGQFDWLTQPDVADREDRPAALIYQVQAQTGEVVEVEQ